MVYEYTRLAIGKNDDILNEYAEKGWRVIAIYKTEYILERKKQYDRS